MAESESRFFQYYSMICEYVYICIYVYKGSENCFSVVHYCLCICVRMCYIHALDKNHLPP